MFSTGQWIFAACFFVAFVIGISYAYKGDRALHKKMYKGSYMVLIGFVLFIVMLFVIKLFFKH